MPWEPGSCPQARSGRRITYQSLQVRAHHQRPASGVTSGAHSTSLKCSPSLLVGAQVEGRESAPVPINHVVPDSRRFPKTSSGLMLAATSRWGRFTNSKLRRHQDDDATPFSSDETAPSRPPAEIRRKTSVALAESFATRGPRRAVRRTQPAGWTLRLLTAFRGGSIRCRLGRHIGNRGDQQSTAARP